MIERTWGFEHPLAGHLRRLEQELGDLLGFAPTLTGMPDIRSVPAGTFPPVNVAATPGAVTVYLFAPGIDPGKVDVSIQQNLLSVRGTRRVADAGGASWYRRERYSGDFSRSVSLPEDVDPERVEARYADGVLTVTVARRAAARPRQIEVR